MGHLLYLCITEQRSSAARWVLSRDLWRMMSLFDNLCRAIFFCCRISFFCFLNDDGCSAQHSCFFHSQSVYRSTCSPPARSCVSLILPSNIPVTGITFVGKWVKVTACLQAGLSTAWGQAQQRESGICVICWEDQICLTYFSFSQNISVFAGTPGWQLFVVPICCSSNVLIDTWEWSLLSSGSGLMCCSLYLVKHNIRGSAVLACLLTECRKMLVLGTYMWMYITGILTKKRCCGRCSIWKIWCDIRAKNHHWL